MNAAEEQIRALVDKETAAWNARDASALAALFHPDTVWPWPPNSTASESRHLFVGSFVLDWKVH